MVKGLRPIRRLLLPAGVTVVLCTMTALVALRQLAHQQEMLTRRTEDVCLQASRRLEVFLDSRLAAAELFGHRWATHENRDFSRLRFEDFGEVVLEHFSGYGAIGLMDTQATQPWVIPRGQRLARGAPLTEATLSLRGRPPGLSMLTAPVELRNGARVFFAALELHRGAERLGRLVVQFDAEALIDTCFHYRIRQEFAFEIHDGDQLLYRYAPEGRSPQAAATSTSRRFGVRNRTWRLTMAPRAAESATAGIASTWPIALLGLILSLGLASLVFLLQRRVELYRHARDRAMIEIAARERAQQALTRSEQRHVQLSRKVLSAQEEERARISRELHDELGQLLTAQRLVLGWLQKHPTAPLEEITEALLGASALVEQSAEELRHICKRLRPPLLDDLGLEPAVKHLIEELAERTGLPIDLKVELTTPEAIRRNEVALVIYRILQESLTNASRHARSTQVEVSVHQSPSELTASVVDDGRGFDPAELSRPEGCGLQGMRERAALVGGEVEILSTPGKGTQVMLRVPWPAADQKELSS